ncbi:MAG: hypothetical protein QGI60_00350, partial [archaeon]|nr:hypothetical protein [archaeon]
MAVRKKKRREISPGELYREIAVSREDFDKGERKLTKRQQHPFVKFCKSVHKRFSSLGNGAKFEEDYRQAVGFLGWDLKPEEFAATAKFVLIAGVILGVIFALAISISPLGEMVADFTGMQQLVMIYIFAPFLIIALLATNYVQSYPISAARTEQTKALTYVPEMVGYMIMSMKLVPNLEKAVEFAADHGTGKIADDFKRIIWDTNIGVHNTLSEGL